MSPVIALRTPTPDATSFDVDGTVDAVARALATTAVERDRSGGHAAHERALIRDSGLLGLSVPRAHGGLEAPWHDTFRAVRRIAQVDSALAHLLGFHHLQLAGVQLYGTPAQQARLYTETTEQRLFWGNALNPIDKRATAVAHTGGFVVDGPKSFCSGSVGSDRLTISAWHEPTQSLLIAAIPTRRDGVTVEGDWDAFGQKQTDSGTVRFAQVAVSDDEVLVRPGGIYAPRATLRSQIAQLVLVNLYAGIARGAFDEARAFTRDHTRAWPASGAARAIDDPVVQHRYGSLSALIRPAEVLGDLAARRLDEALARGEALTAAERGEVAIAVTEAKVLAHRAALEVSSQLFELTGARSTSQQHGLDRFWRNARVHTLHDPIDQKLRDLGRHALDGRLPDPSPYG